MSVFFNYKDKDYPFFIKDGNHQQYIRPIAEKVCIGKGIDIGCNRPEWACPNAKDLLDAEFPAPWNDALNIPVKDNHYDFVFSSHCLEHIGDYYSALQEWTRVLKHKGILLLYLPHKNMEYWRPRNNRKHLRIFDEENLKNDLFSLGYKYVTITGCDLSYSFAVLAEKF